MRRSRRSRGTRSRKRQLWTDERLIAACLDGDVDAWSELPNRYAGLIYSVALQIGLKNDDASDVLQNVSMVMLDHLADLRCSDRLSSWLITVTRREAVRVMKRNQLRTGESEGAALELLQGAGESMTDDLSDRLVDLQDQQIVREAMERLPERCRRILELLFCQDPPASYAEAAAQLGIPIGSIGPTRARCLDRLRKVLAQMGF
ncbi:MAG: sigma-70 family RNA polymerase sigma factor [Armatimonadetes bacterium]|nr:sigma-70 family RNA polymerase sigma factor [Armatimonadota bacterium]